MGVRNTDWIGNLIGYAKALADTVLDLVFPPDVSCLCCGRTIGEHGADGLCAACVRALEALEAQQENRPIDLPEGIEEEINTQSEVPFFQIIVDDPAGWHMAQKQRQQIRLLKRLEVFHLFFPRLARAQVFFRKAVAIDTADAQALVIDCDVGIGKIQHFRPGPGK